MDVAVSLTPPLLADTIHRLLARNDIRATVVLEPCEAQFDVAVTMAHRIPLDADVTITLPDTLRDGHPVRVRDREGVSELARGDLDAVVALVRSLVRDPAG